MTALLPTDGQSELSGLEPLRRYVDRELAGKHLNDVLIGPPTPARLAAHVASWSLTGLGGPPATALSSVLVYIETNSRARYVVPRTVQRTAR